MPTTSYSFFKEVKESDFSEAILLIDNIKLISF